MDKKHKELIPVDLQNVLATLKSKDLEEILKIKKELIDNWNKKQIFRTETEMRVSVLNDGKHPTQASKYWQSVREMSSHFEAMINLSFELRKNNLQRLRLERKIQEAYENGDDLDVMEIQIDLDQNIYIKAGMEQIIHDRVREILTWSKIKSELDDGSFDTQNVNTHQFKTLELTFNTRINALNQNSDYSEVINAVGLHQTLQRLKSSEENTLLTFDKARQQKLNV
jgi:hypothetical protein